MTWDREGTGRICWCEMRHVVEQQVWLTSGERWGLMSLTNRRPCHGQYDAESPQRLMLWLYFKSVSHSFTENVTLVLGSYLKQHEIKQPSHDCQVHLLSYLDKYWLDWYICSRIWGLGTILLIVYSLLFNSSKCICSLCPILFRSCWAGRTTSALPFFMNN